MRISCNFVAIVGLTNNERYLLHNMRAGKHCDYEKIVKLFSNK